VPKKDHIKTENLSRLMIYILAHKPFEFGLVPDQEGFLSFKELLHAVHEEAGWGYVRQGDINEVLLGKDRDLFEVDNKRIRAIDRRWSLDLNQPAGSLPKALFMGIRRKAHPVVMEKGLKKLECGFYVLSPGREMAERIGKRRDPRPVLLEVMAGAAERGGNLFCRFGDLFLCPEIPVRYIAGPPAPKDVIKQGKEKSDRIPDSRDVFLGGTFTLDLNRDTERSRRYGGRKKKGWKEEARKRRRKGKGHL
jgi:putative RNA 2'-phosphotransferase